MINISILEGYSAPVQHWQIPAREQKAAYIQLLQAHDVCFFFLLFIWKDVQNSERSFITRVH